MLAWSVRAAERKRLPGLNQDGEHHLLMPPVGVLPSSSCSPLGEQTAHSSHFRAIFFVGEESLRARPGGAVGAVVALLPWTEWGGLAGVDRGPGWVLLLLSASLREESQPRAAPSAAETEVA